VRSNETSSHPVVGHSTQSLSGLSSFSETNTVVGKMNAPPIYSYYSSEDQLASTSFSSPRDPQITISPAADALHFQQGCLGIDGERPALEGEIQIKGAQGRVWESLSTSSPGIQYRVLMMFDIQDINSGKQRVISLTNCSTGYSVDKIIPTK
jgi:hypothetical protein